MSVVVLKFGGTSLANVGRIRTVAHRVVEEVQAGHQVVVVVSAMAGVTNQLVDWVYECGGDQPDSAEYDVVVSNGEQVSAGLMALTLRDLGVRARSWMAWQVPILTSSRHKRAAIECVVVDALEKVLAQSEVVIVPGFQGIDKDHRLTTLGRGGSDYTAVALAHALSAERCDIYTDVDGVFTADPHIVAKAQKLDAIHFEEMAALAWQGAKVLQPQAVDYAKAHNVNIRVLSSFNRSEGTLVSDDAVNEQNLTGISSNGRLVYVQVEGFEHRIEDFLTFAEKLQIQLDYVTLDAQYLSFTVARTDLNEVESFFQMLGCKIRNTGPVAHIGLVGRSVLNDRQNVAKVVQLVLEEKNVKVVALDVADHDQHITPASVRRNLTFNVVVSDEQAKTAVVHLHTAFGLDRGSQCKKSVSAA